MRYGVNMMNEEVPPTQINFFSRVRLAQMQSCKITHFRWQSLNALIKDWFDCSQQRSTVTVCLGFSISKWTIPQTLNIQKSLFRFGPSNRIQSSDQKTVLYGAIEAIRCMRWTSWLFSLSTHYGRPSRFFKSTRNVLWLSTTFTLSKSL